MNRHFVKNIQIVAMKWEFQTLIQYQIRMLAQKETLFKKEMA